ncbi:MAG: TIGR02452 family protein [Acidobacteria bacterium]|nr:TIGR02452 family protein [Acidobacteriota bacterium]
MEIHTALIPRELAARLGRETVEYLRAGGFSTPSGRFVDLRLGLEAATRGTVEYPPERAVHAASVTGPPPRITVENESILVVGRRMAATGPVAGLNFASATSPGGGFLGGARAQEECIARSSGLYACLEHRDMYPRHRAALDEMYTDYVIYSPDVPVFRTDEGDLLDEPWTMSVLTSPAVHGHGIRHYAPQRWDEIPGVMRARTRKVLAVAAAHGQRRLILGAWGCGAFGLDGDMMAGIFAETLRAGRRRIRRGCVRHHGLVARAALHRPVPAGVLVGPMGATDMLTRATERFTV